MITTAEFKKQIAKPFGNEMRKLGFKGTGFTYIQETDGFLFAVYIDSGKWGGSCSTGLAVHPKQIKKNSAGPLNLKNLKLHQYEFRMSLSKFARDISWKYADDLEENLNTDQIINRERIILLIAAAQKNTT